MKWLLAPLLLLCFALSGAQVQPFVATPTTLAWQRSYDLGLNKDEYVYDYQVDSTGASYVLSGFQIPGWSYYEVRKYSASGTFLWKYNYQSGVAILQSLAIDSAHNVYVCGDDQTPGTLIGRGFVTKLNPTGYPEWTTAIPSLNGRSLSVYKAGANPAGGITVVCNQEMVPGPDDTVLAPISATGTLGTCVELTSIKPDSVAFQKTSGNVIVAGRERDVPGGAWVAYSPNLTFLKGGHKLDLSGPPVVFYRFLAFVDPSDNVYVASNQVQDPNGTTVYRLQIFAFDTTLTSIWTSSPILGNLYLDLFSAFDLSHVVYCLINPSDSGNGYSARYLGANGVEQWNRVLLEPSRLGIDGTRGAFTIDQTGDYTNKGYVIQETRANGTDDWRITFGPTLYQQTYVTHAMMFGNSLRLAAYRDNHAALNFDALVSSYAIGTTLSAFTFPIATNVGGGPMTGKLNLNGAAPAAGALISLSSGIPSALWVPSSAKVAAGGISIGFGAIAAPVDVKTIVPVNATYNGVTRTAYATLMPAALSAVKPASTSVKGGVSVQCTITMTGKTGLAGRTVLLSSNSTSATVPASAKVPGGASSVTFNLTTKAVLASTPVTITAKDGAVTKTAQVTLTP